MSGWDKPRHGDRPDDGPDRPGERVDKNGERPFPGAPLDRPAVPSPSGTSRSWDEIKAERRGGRTQQEHGDALAAQQERLEKAELARLGTPAPDGRPERRDLPPPTGSPGTDQVREVSAKAPADTPAERAEVREKTARGDPGDIADQRADRDAGRVAELESELADAESKLADTKAELAEERADRRKLTDVVADQADEIKRLRAQLEAKDAPADGRTSPVDTASNNTSDQARDQHQEIDDRPWYKKVPGEAKVGLFTAGAGVIDSVATATHGMSGSTEGVVASLIGLGVAGLAIVREHYKQTEGKRQ